MFMCYETFDFIIIGMILESSATQNQPKSDPKINQKFTKSSNEPSNVNKLLVQCQTESLHIMPRQNRVGIARLSEILRHTVW